MRRGCPAADHQLGRTTTLSKRKPTPEALAAIPDLTCRTWPRIPIPPGTIVGKHVANCRTNGGTVSPYLCPHCSRHVEGRYRSALAILDSRVRGR